MVLSNGSFSNELAIVDSTIEEQQLDTVNDKVRLYHRSLTIRMVKDLAMVIQITGNFFNSVKGRSVSAVTIVARYFPKGAIYVCANHGYC